MHMFRSDCTLMLDSSTGFMLMDPHFTSTTGVLTGLRVSLEFAKIRAAAGPSAGPPQTGYDTTPTPPPGSGLPPRPGQEFEMTEASPLSIFDTVDTPPVGDERSSPGTLVPGGRT